MPMQFEKACYTYILLLLVSILLIAFGKIVSMSVFELIVVWLFVEGKGQGEKLKFGSP